jgi:hypothetical protein
MSRPLPLALVLLLALSASAPGASFDFVTTIDGAHPYSYEGHMTVSNTFCRVDVTRGSHPLFNPEYSIISQRNGQSLLILDHKLKTYFVRDTNGLTGPMAGARGFARTTAANASIDVRREREPGDEVESRRTTRYSIHVTYDMQITVDDERLSGKVDIKGSLWTVEGPSQTALPWGLQFGAKTGFQEIDRAIARKMPHGLPVRQMITVTRRIADGAALAETMTTTVSHISEEPVSPSLFGAPQGYQLREPSFSFGSP